MKKTFLITFVVILVGILVWGFINPLGIRGAYANNAWSVRFVDAFFNNPNKLVQVPDPPETHIHGKLFLIQESLLQKNYDRAMEHIRPLVEANDQLAQDAYVALLYLQEDYAKALEIWEKVGNIRLIEWAARDLADKGRQDLAYLGYQTLYRVDPEKYTISVAMPLKNQGELDKALLIFQKAINDFPNSEFKYHWLRYSADIYRAQMNYDQAEATYMQALQVNPKDPRTWRNLGLMYAGDFKDYEKAATYIEKMIEVDPENASGYFYLGLTYESAGMKEKAIQAYQSALEVDPDYSDAAKAINRLTETDE